MNLLQRLSFFWLLILIQPPLHLLAADDEETHIIVRFCVPENHIYPFFMTKDGKLTGINADMMSQVFNDNVLPIATLKYVKRPWKRCNADLESGLVDMMIGGFDPKRDNVSYPSKLGFNLADSILSIADVCFFSIAGKQMEKVRRGMEGKAPFIVGIEAGFSKQHSDKIEPQWVELFNPVEKYQMLEKGRIDAVVQVCAMDGINLIAPKVASVGLKELEALHPAYLSNPAYIVFSDKFADTYNELAKRIVRLSLTVDKAQVYRRYRPID